MMASLLGSKVEEKIEPEKPIDREKTCPLLLRVFCNMSRHHSLAEYSRGQVPANELQIYTWMDATLKELTSLVKEVNPDARRKGTFFDFAQVYPEMTGRGLGGLGGVTHRMREIGSTCSGQKGADDSKTLAQVRFTIGDYLDIAITPPNMRDMRDMRGGPGGPMLRRMRPY